MTFDPHFIRLKSFVRENSLKVKLLLISTAILIWGGQTYIWNPFWLYYQAYPWYALIWAFTLSWYLPGRRRRAKNLLPPPPLESLQEPEDDAV